MKKPSSDAVALLALLISGIALAVALFEAYNNRQTARATVKPILEASFEFNKNGTGWELDNSGMGPAAIKWFDVFVDGAQVPSWQLVGRALNLKKDVGYRFILPAGQWIKVPAVSGKKGKKQGPGASTIGRRLASEPLRSRLGPRMVEH